MSHRLFGLFIVLVLGLLLVGNATAQHRGTSLRTDSARHTTAWPVNDDDENDDEYEDTYEVTVTNITPGSGAAAGQILNGFVAATHNSDFRLFSLGQPASAGLAALAEDADTSILVPALNANPDVLDVQLNPTDPILPGQSASVIVTADDEHSRLSLAAMLVTTNDAFAALNGVPLPEDGGSAFFALAYDAGSEVNTESCSDIPGPPCGSPFVRVTAGAEGYVSVHSGIHGVGVPLQILPKDRDWRNPVAWITIRALGGDDDDDEGSDD